MKRISYIGPSVILFIAIAATWFGGPYVMDRMASADEKARWVDSRQRLDETLPRLADLRDAFRHVPKVVEPSVVHISVLRGRQRGSGSGWIYDDQGHIVTNNHVVMGASQIIVKFSDKTEVRARLVGVDPRTDIAVLKVERPGLIPAIRADYDKEAPYRGDIVFAFGSPFQYEFSVTQGIISGLGRRTGLLGPDGYENFLQTDAAINPGNSGGPLTDIRGQVIGMNTMISTRTGAFNGIGFAIPMDLIEPVVDQLIETGEVRRGYLGIRFSSDQRSLKLLGVDHGVLVEEVIPRSPAQQYGLQRGDVIIAMDGDDIKDQGAFRRLIAEMGPGRKVKMKVWRNRQTLDLEITLGELPTRDEVNRLSELPMEEGVNLGVLGYSDVIPMTRELAQQLNQQFRPGVYLRRVDPGSDAWLSGFRGGVTILAVNGTAVDNIDDLRDALNEADKQKPVSMLVWTGARELKVEIARE